MKILKFPHPALMEKCKDVTEFNETLQEILNDMWTIMLEASGIGLAANQVGIKLNMFTMLGPNNETIYIINPKIINKSNIPINLKEGCLSAPGEYVLVPSRSSWIEIEYQDVKGNVINRTFNGIHSVCIEHEMEHLEGKAFLKAKGLSRNIRKGLAKKWGL